MMSNTVWCMRQHSGCFFAFEVDEISQIDQEVDAAFFLFHCVKGCCRQAKKDSLVCCQSVLGFLVISTMFSI